MVFQQTPICLELLRVLADQIQDIEPIFDQHSEEFGNLKQTLLVSGSLTSNLGFMSNPLQITYFQILCIAGLSMAGGWFVPVISLFTYRKPVVGIHWGDRLTDSFTFGHMDSSFEKFLAYFQRVILKLPSHQTGLSVGLFKRLHVQILQYNDLLIEVESKWQQLKVGPYQIKALLENKSSSDFLFMLLSCFPPEQLNTLFIKIQTYFPDELTIDSPDGNRLNVKVLFQTPSTDLTYLISKVKLYMQLFFGSDLPIIQQITQSQTKRLMLDFLQNKQLFEQVQSNVELILVQQVTPRTNIYKVLDLHLQKVLPRT